MRFTDKNKIIIYDNKKKPDSFVTFITEVKKTTTTKFENNFLYKPTITLAFCKFDSIISIEISNFVKKKRTTHKIQLNAYFFFTRKFCKKIAQYMLYCHIYPHRRYTGRRPAVLI